MTRLELLELIATLAQNQRDLERIFPKAFDQERVAVRSQEVQWEMDEALDDLKWLK